MDGAMIRLEGVRKALGGKEVLRGVDLEVRQGETLVIIGGSGCGKTVLLRHVAGLLRPDLGKVWIEDAEISSFSEREMYSVRRRMGVLFQGAALFDSLCVGENVSFALDEHNLCPVGDRPARVAECLRRVGLVGIEKKMPAELSGGMRKRVGLARALAVEPDILLYDEPTTGLDPITADVINDLILQMQKNLHVTSVVVTHDMTSATKVGDRIAMLLDGQVLDVTEAKHVWKSENPAVQQFIHGRAEGPIRVPGH